MTMMMGSCRGARDFRRGTRYFKTSALPPCINTVSSTLDAQNDSLKDFFCKRTIITFFFVFPFQHLLGATFFSSGATFGDKDRRCHRLLIPSTLAHSARATRVSFSLFSTASDAATDFLRSSYDGCSNRCLRKSQPTRTRFAEALGESDNYAQPGFAKSFDLHFKTQNGHCFFRQVKESSLDSHLFFYSSFFSSFRDVGHPSLDMALCWAKA